MEQRVQELEDAGVRATKEVQLAAQQVDKENQLLRWLLKTQFGVNAGQISKVLSELNYPTDFCMQSSVRLEGGADMSRVSGEPVSSLISTTKPGEVVRPRATQGSPFPTPMSSREERQQGVGIGPESPEYQFKSPITPLAGIDALQSAQATSHVHLFNHGLWTTLQTPPSQSRTHEGRNETELDHSCHLQPVDQHLRDSCATSEKATDSWAGETPCEEAARIIASLRGQNTQSDVWSELGCGTSQSCRVKNLSVFELMDMQ